MCAAGVVGAATQEPGGDAASVWVVIFVGAFVLGAMLIAWFVASDAAVPADQPLVGRALVAPLSNAARNGQQPTPVP